MFLNKSDWESCSDEHIFLRRKLKKNTYEIIKAKKRTGEKDCDWLHTVIFLDDYPADKLAAAVMDFGRTMEEVIEYVRASDESESLMDLVAMDLGETLDSQFLISEEAALRIVKKLTGVVFEEV